MRLNLMSGIFGNNCIRALLRFILSTSDRAISASIDSPVKGDPVILCKMKRDNAYCTILNPFENSE